MTGTIIVAFDGSTEERAAIKVLTEELDNTKVVQYGSFEYHLVKMRAINSIVFIGHGDENGIRNRGDIISSEEFGPQVQSCIARDVYVLSCFAGGLTEQADLDRSVTFSGVIDAEMGALAIAIRVLLSKGKIDRADSAFDRFVDVLEERIENPDTFLPLAYLSNAELYNFIATLAIGIVIGIISASAVFALSQHFAPAATEAAAVINITYRELFRSLLVAIAINGASAASTFINSIFGGVYSMAIALETVVWNTVNIAINRMNFFEWLLFIALTALEVILIILTGGYGLVARIAAATLIATMNAAIIAIADYSDNNGTPCMSVLEAISQIFS